LFFCRETQDCFWYSWDSATSICLALQDCPVIDQSETSTISGNKECSEFSCNKAEKCEGVVVHAGLASNTETCLRYCNINERCHWFTFYLDQGLCIQLEDCPKMTPCQQCISGQQECKEEESKKNKVMIVYDSEVKLIDLTNLTNICQLPQYPVPTFGPAAIIFDDNDTVVRSCGGYIKTKSGATTSRCFTFDGLEWKDMASKNASIEASYDVTLSSYIPGYGWWLFGCNDWHGAGCPVDKTQSEIFLDSTHMWTDGPKLPQISNDSLYQFPGSYCTVQLNSTHTMVTGGQLDFDVGAISEVWFYDWSQDIWVQGPSMEKARRQHTCVNLGEGRVMVAGGFSENGQETLTVEIFDQNVGSWYRSRDFPEDQNCCSYGSKLVNWAGVPVWINGQHLWKFEEGEWLQIGQEWSFHEYDQVVMVPDVFVPNC